MKKSILAILFFIACVGMSQAFTEQFKMFDNGPKTKTCRTGNLNVTNERDPMFCSYVFTPFQRGKKEGTLLFEFLMNPDNEKSVEIKNKVLVLLKNLKEEPNAKVSISLELKDGENLYFDSNCMGDWKTEEWRQLLRVGYDRDNGEYRTYIMFPLEQMRSDQRELNSNKKRHNHVIDQLQAKNIVKIIVKKISTRGNVELEIPFERPTDGTFTDMIKKIKNKKK